LLSNTLFIKIIKNGRDSVLFMPNVPIKSLNDFDRIEFISINLLMM